MKRLCSIISTIAAAICSTLSGCGGSQPSTPSDDSAPPPPKTEPEIRWVGHDSGYRGKTTHHADGKVEHTTGQDQ